MLLGLVGTSGEALQMEARAIVGALKSIGCRVQVFSESCQEAERVLTSYLKASPSDRHGRTHTAILKGEIDRAYVQTVASDVEAAAEKFGVSVRNYSLEAFPNDHKYFDDERNKDVYSFLSWDNPLARDHDAFAVTAIMRMRHGKHKNDPLQNSHVFISSNEKLVRKARDYCLQSKLVRETQCGPVVDTRDLATIAWLRTGFENSEKIPISHMLAQCERGRRDLLQDDQGRAAVATIMGYPEICRTGHLRIHQRLLQPAPKALGTWLEKPLGFRSSGRINEKPERHQNVTGPNCALRTGKPRKRPKPNTKQG